MVALSSPTYYVYIDERSRFSLCHASSPLSALSRLSVCAFLCICIQVVMSDLVGMTRPVIHDTGPLLSTDAAIPVRVGVLCICGAIAS